MRHLALIAVASVTFASATALAAPGADELATQARADAVAGRYQKAIDGYKRAFAVEAKATYRCNIGVAYYRLEQWPRAHFSLAQCIAKTSSLPASVVAKVSQAYAYVEQTLKAGDYAPVQVTTVPAAANVSASFLADGETFRGGRIVWAPFGTHSVRVSAKGYHSKTLSVSVASRAQRNEVIRLEAVAVAPAVDSPPLTPPSTQVPVAASRHSDHTIAPRRGPAWIAFGVGGAALAGAVVFHLKARDTVNSFDGVDRESKIETLERQAIMTYSLYGVAAVATGLGAYLWLRASSNARKSARKSNLRVGATVTTSGPRHAGVWARWSM